MPSEMQVFAGKEWKSIGAKLNPGDPPASISDNNPRGRQIYILECQNDSTSFLYRSLDGIDIECQKMRAVISQEGMEVVCVLGKDSPACELDIVTMFGENARIRFRHY